MQSDGSDQPLLWSTSDRMYQELAVNSDLVWSPDSTRIAFAGWHNGQPEITVVDRIRAQLRYLAVGIDPRWSPDGTRIVFTSMLNNESVVSVIPADGTQRTPLAVGYNPRWSPDGAQIAYVVGPLRPRDPVPVELYLMSPDGANQHPIFKLTTWCQSPPASGSSATSVKCPQLWA
jgi:Tol biopolymer transport system component